jgi:hypothetical protein
MTRAYSLAFLLIDDQRVRWSEHGERLACNERPSRPVQRTQQITSGPDTFACFHFSGHHVDSAPKGNWGDAVDFDFPPRLNFFEHAKGWYIANTGNTEISSPMDHRRTR